ncbi:MAG: Protease 4 [Phycisphaerae bacterium]|nr:Protease 4 [Phycisphaerae bacterium]
MTCRAWIRMAAIAMVCAAALAAPQGEAQAQQAAKSVAHIKVSGQITEGPAMFDLFARRDAQTLRSYLDRLAKAAGDKSLDAVVLTIENPQMGYSQMIELRSAVRKVRDAGKPVWVYMESAEAPQYVLATAGDQVWLAPAGGLDLVGLRMEMVFIKSLLDKIGVQADLLQVGEFKGAREPFTQDKPSPELTGELNRMLDGLWDRMARDIGEGRGLKKGEVEKLIDDGPYLADDALKARLVDQVGTRAQMTEALGKRLGGEVNYDSRYGLPQRGLGIDLSNPFALFKLLMTKGPAVASPNRVALIYVDGMIVSGESKEGLLGGHTCGSESLRKAIERARNDEGVKAIVVRIDSPGGSALASDVIWQAVKRAAKVKPLVVSVGDMAASGGYYIASAGPVIFAQPTSLVGSIGVVGGKVVIGPMLAKIGVSTATLSRGVNANLMSMDRPFTDAERARVQKLMERIYGQFVEAVKEGRGQKIKDIDKVARGRLFLGAEAMDNGLVDREGGLADAIRFAAGQAKLDAFDIEVLPKPKTLLDLISGSLSGQAAVADWARQVLTMQAGSLGALREMAPWQLRRAAALLTLLGELRGEHVLAAWPLGLEIH